MLLPQDNIDQPVLVSLSQLRLVHILPVPSAACTKTWILLRFPIRVHSRGRTRMRPNYRASVILLGLYFTQCSLFPSPPWQFCTHTCSWKAGRPAADDRIHFNAVGYQKLYLTRSTTLCPVLGKIHHCGLERGTRSSSLRRQESPNNFARVAFYRLMSISLPYINARGHCGAQNPTVSLFFLSDNLSVSSAMLWNV